MRELSGLGYDEIGSALGSTPAAAKQLVYEARSALHEMAEGREMSCELVRTSLSANDGRRLRSRRFRAHLEACASCRDFQRSIDVRRRDLAALAPPLPALAAASILHGLSGGGHAGAASSLAGLAGGGTGKAVATSAVAKAVATVALVATVGAGTAGVTGNLPVGSGHKKQHEAVPAGRSASSTHERTGAGTPGTPERERSRGESTGSKPGTIPSGHGNGRPAHARTPVGKALPLSHRPSARGRHGAGRPVTPGRAHSAPAPRPGPSTRRPVGPRKPAAIPPGRAEPNRGGGRKPGDAPLLDPGTTSP
jgi:hypothetical protein